MIGDPLDSIYFSRCNRIFDCIVGFRTDRIVVKIVGGKAPQAGEAPAGTAAGFASVTDITLRSSPFTCVAESKTVILTRPPYITINFPRSAARKAGVPATS